MSTSCRRSAARSTSQSECQNILPMVIPNAQSQLIQCRSAPPNYHERWWLACGWDLEHFAGSSGGEHTSTTIISILNAFTIIVSILCILLTITSVIITLTTIRAGLLCLVYDTLCLIYEQRRRIIERPDIRNRKICHWLLSLPPVIIISCHLLTATMCHFKTSKVDLVS